MTDGFEAHIRAITTGDVALWVMLRVPECPVATAIEAATEAVDRQLTRTFTNPEQFVDLYIEASLIASSKME